VTLWIDGDACPAAVKRLVYRASERLGLPVRLVANQPVAVPDSPLVRFVRVKRGLDVADHHILAESEPGDVVISADIPLAAALVARGVGAISPHGEVYSEDNIGQRLAVRDLLHQLRDEGAVTGGPSAFGEADQRRFANALDRELTRRLHRGGVEGPAR
jgi:uncharacterized protein YaiI (UPF0178 family)